jgi:hypothetical protein
VSSHLAEGGQLQAQVSDSKTDVGSNTVLSQVLFPSILLTNANHLLNKTDELYCIVQRLMPGLICITETWLDNSVPDSLVSYSGYTAFRRDRSPGVGGGVICYVLNSYSSQSFEVHPKFANNHGFDFEIVWVMLRPNILPRPIGCIIVAVLYVPPWYNVERCNALKSYILMSIDYFRAKYSHPVFLYLW